MQLGAIVFITIAASCITLVVLLIALKYIIFWSIKITKP
jgi:hypothetical protein